MHRLPKNSCISLERLVPSASWIVKAFETPESEILSIAGLDAVVFLRSLVLRCFVLIIPLFNLFWFSLGVLQPFGVQR